MGNKIREGDRVRVARVDPEDPLVLERTQCFLGWVGAVGTTTGAERWVEFDRACSDHGDTGGVFTESELEKVSD